MKGKNIKKSIDDSIIDNAKLIRYTNPNISDSDLVHEVVSNVSFNNMIFLLHENCMDVMLNVNIIKENCVNVKLSHDYKESPDKALSEKTLNFIVDNVKNRNFDSREVLNKFMTEVLVYEVAFILQLYLGQKTEDLLIMTKEVVKNKN